jgi:hypothetical protein
MIARRNRTTRAAVRRKGLRWAIAVIVAAPIALGWPGTSSRKADLHLQATAPITAQTFAGIWVGGSTHTTIRLHIRPAGADIYDLRSTFDFLGAAANDANVYETRAHVVGLGDGPSALLWLDEPIPPFKIDPKSAPYFEPSGYFVIRYREPSFELHDHRYWSTDRDRLDICPIPKDLMMRAVRSGRLKGMVVEQPGDLRVVVTDSPKGIRSFLLAYADADSSAFTSCPVFGVGFRGVRQLKWHRPIPDDPYYRFLN